MPRAGVRERATLDDVQRRATYHSYLRGELEAAAVYQAMAETESDPERAAVFVELVQAEMRHAARWAEKLGMDPAILRPARKGLRLRLLKWGARWLGTNRIVPMLLRGEARDINVYSQDPEARDIAQEERGHGRALRGLVSDPDSVEAIRAENNTFTGGSLRAAVLGVNDGLVSNFSLVMGVAGGTANSDFILLAGVAGLLAGAFSMAAGEYVSMRSQRDVYEHQISRERAEIEQWPKEEEEELVLLYRAKGLSQEEAQRLAKSVMANPEVALDTMVREELGLDPSKLGSPWGASLSSFAAFVAGAIVPIMPYILGSGTLAFFLGGILSGGALLAVGGTLAWLTDRSIRWGALRMFFAGSAAAAVTFGVGRLIGVSLST
ncbi:MAG: VIT1/CCC1 transporter family protein [Chloroflexi bacterium]|nr:VIT1/CCC1 transporter family protein [Chloroflexota bacterium]